MTQAVLSRLAAKYIWWQPASATLRQPQRIAAQVMEMGDWDDVILLSEAQGEDFLRNALLHAEPVQLSERSWHY